MDLQTFVSQALRDIINGVESARVITCGAVVPDYSGNASIGPISSVQPIKFEVNVTAEARQGSEAKIGVVAGMFSGSVKGDSGSNSGHSATLTFSVPVDFMMNHPKPPSKRIDIQEYVNGK